MSREPTVRTIEAAPAADSFFYVDSNGASTEFKLNVPSIQNFKEELDVYLADLPPVVQLFYIEKIYKKMPGISYLIDISHLSREGKVLASGDFDEDPRKTEHINILKDKYVEALAKCKDSPLAEQYIQKRNVLDHDPTNVHRITPARQRAIDLYPDALDRQRQELMLGARNQYDIEVIVANIIKYPENASVYLIAGSQYRTQLTENYDQMRDMINRSSPALRDQIVSLKLIDDVWWPWRRYSLRSLMRKADEIEMKLPQNVVKQWVDAVKTNSTGFFAGRRLAGYKQATHNQSMEVKVDFLMANPDDAKYFFKDNDFVNKLCGRLDLFYILLSKENLIESMRQHLLTPPRRDTGTLIYSAIKKGDLGQLKAIKKLLSTLNLTAYYNSKELVQASIDGIEENIRLKAEDAKRNKGKEESNDMAEVKSVSRVFELRSEDYVAMLNVDDFSGLDNLLQYHQKAKQIIIFSKKHGVIININLNSELPDVGFYVEENSKFKTGDILVVIQRHFPEKIKITPDVRWIVTSATFQEALEQGEIPHLGSYQVTSEPVSTFRPFAFIGQLYNYLKRPKAKDIIKIDPSSDSESDSDTESANARVKHARALGKLSSPRMREVGSEDSMQEKSSDEMAVEAVVSEEEVAVYIKQYITARDAFRAGNYKDSTLLISALFNTLHEKSGLISGQDKFLPIVIGLLTKANASYYDVIMAEELLDAELPSTAYGQITSAYGQITTAYGQLTTLHGALNSLKESGLFSEPNYKKTADHLNEDSLTTFLAGNSPAIQLYMLERMFKSILAINAKAVPKIYSVEQIEDISLLKDKYVQIAKQCRDDGLAKKIIVKGTLLDFDPEGKPTAERKAVSKLFSHDPIMTLELRFRASKSLNIAMLKDIPPKGKVAYFIAHPEHALFFLKDESVQKETAKPEYLTAMINAGSAELRQAIRQSGILERKIKNKEEVIKQLSRVVDREVHNILKHPELAYTKLENDFLWEEIAVRADLMSKIEKKYPHIYKERQHTDYGTGNGEKPTKHF